MSPSPTGLQKLPVLILPMSPMTAAQSHGLPYWVEKMTLLYVRSLKSSPLRMQEK